MTLRDTLDQIETDLNQYYEVDFDTGEDDSNANRALRWRIKALILAAHAAPDPEILRDALACLSTSTGCAEDYGMLMEITDELVDKHIVTAGEVKQLLEGAPVKRWL